MDNFRIPKESAAWKIPWKKTCGKTTTKMGRQHQEGLSAAAEYKKMADTSRGQGYLRAKCWRRQGPMRTLAAQKKNKKKKTKKKKIS
jgi:hypothetical protein